MTLAEVLVGVFIIGISALPIAELLRWSTSSLQTTEVEAVARGLACDLLERFAGPPLYGSTAGSTATQALLGIPVPIDLLLKTDGAFARGFPGGWLPELLARHQVKVTIDRQLPFTHPAVGQSDALSLWTVKVSWQESVGQRELKLARLFADR